MNEKENPKQRIMDASVKLFASKGFSSVGVREITKEADVNISMISYYFDGKVGILKEIINGFFDDYLDMMQEIGKMDAAPMGKIDLLIRRLIEFIKTNQDMCRVSILELPREIPELAEIKAEKVKRIKEFFITGILGDFSPGEEFYSYLPVIGPALINMVLSHFVLGPVIQKAFDLKFDEAFYEKYADILSKLFLTGLTGVIEEIKQ